MPTPDVRIRLSAEGVAEVVSALRKVQGEAQKVGGGASKAFGGFNAALSGTTALLGQLAAAVSIGALVALTRQGAEAADQLGKLAQRVGASVENLSALRLAASTADVSMGDLQATFSIFNKRVAELQSGSKEAVAAFKLIGVSAKDLAGKDAAERLELIAKAFGKLKDSPEKSAAALSIFGRSAAVLIPLLNDLSEGGLDRAREAATRLGVTLTEDTARAAQAVNDDFTVLKLQLETGFARFVEGFAPAVHASLTDVQNALGENAGGWIEWGKAVGKIIGFTILIIEQVLDRIGSSIAQIASALGGLTAAAGATLTGNFKAALFILKETKDRASEIEDEFAKREAKRLQRADRLGQAISAGISGLPGLRAGTQETNAPERAKVDDAEEKRLARERERLRLEAERKRFQSDTARGESALNALGAERANVEQRVALGVLSQADAAKLNTAAQKEALPALKEILALYVAIAIQNPFDEKAAARAASFAAEITKIETEIAATDSIMAKVGATAKDALQGALVNALTTGIAEARTFLDLLRNIGLAIVQAVQQLLAFEIAKRIVSSIPGFSGGGEAQGRAAGGFISGPGGPTGDSIPAMLSAGEYVVRAAVVAQPGILSHLESLNRSVAFPAIARASGPRRFAAGGLATEGVGRSENSLTVSLAPGLVLSELSTPEGERAVVRVLAKNRRGASNALGNG